MTIQTALVTVDSASLDEPLLLHVRLSARVLRALSVLTDVQDFYGDGHFDVAADPAEHDDGPPDDDELVEYVVRSGADEAQIEAFRDYIEINAAEPILSGRL